MRKSLAYNKDCLDAMREMPDKCFDLAVVDPPYGGGGSPNVHVERERERERYTAERQILNPEREAGLEGGLTSIISVVRTGGKWSKKYQVQKGGIFSQDIRHWDIAPPDEYFRELARVSKNQIIWGGNYFYLPPTRCFLVWDKKNIHENFSMAMCEYAWTSFNDNAKIFRCIPQGTASEKRFHPTQKPVALYRWIFSRYAKPGNKILDTHLGSGSSRVAAYEAGLDFVGYEIDPTYFKLQEERFASHTSQLSMFD